MAKSATSEKSLRAMAARFARLDLDPALRARRTTSDYLADALRTAIYDGQFADGEVLNQVQLATYFKVSRVPIREALRRLQAEGVVSNVAHRQVVVIGLELHEIIELIELRALLECYLLEKTAPRLGGEEIAHLRRLCDEMDLIRDYDYGWVLKNWEFHRRLYQPSNSSAAIALVEQLHLKVERYVRRAGRAERLGQAAAEHRQILADLERQDLAGACAQLRDHILHSGQEVRRFLATVGDGPPGGA